MRDELADAYRECRRISRHHSSSYFWATSLLPADRRPHVHALYAFARVADDLVDHPALDPATTLATFRHQFDEALAGRAPLTPVLAAVAHTATTFSIPAGAFDRFFRSMEMDLSISSYATWSDLLAYMDGSAAVIGEMMLPILDPSDRAIALEPARDLGLAFQLTNFLRDVGEDLDRGRQYMPQEDLRRFDVELERRIVTSDFIELMRFEIERCRSLYRAADAGIALLPPPSARSIRTAKSLYSRILDEIEANEYDVFTTRARLSTPKKLSLVARSVMRH